MRKVKEPLRIAQIVGKWVGGGVEAVLMNYYRHIDHEKIQFDFICDSDSTDIPYEEIEKLGGRVILCPPYQHIFKYIKELKRIFRENRYRIVHSHINTLSVFPLYAAKCAKIKIRIAHSHSTTNKKEWKRNLLKQFLRPFSKVFANYYMCCSNYAGKWLFGKKIYERGDVYLLNNAIDLDSFKYQKDVRDSVRNSLGIKSNTLVLGHVGRFVETKNHSFLIDVFNEVHKKNNDSILLLIGQGPLVNEMKNKVLSLGLSECVRFLGQRSDVNKLYQAMDIFLLPSLYEGLGMVLIEAQASNLTCIASTNVPKIAKIAPNVTFCDLNNIDEWVNCINSNKLFSRKNNFAIISKQGYNIKEECKKLEDKYLELGD